MKKLLIALFIFLPLVAHADFWTDLEAQVQRNTIALYPELGVCVNAPSSNYWWNSMYSSLPYPNNQEPVNPCLWTLNNNPPSLNAYCFMKPFPVVKGLPIATSIVVSGGFPPYYYYWSSVGVNSQNCGNQSTCFVSSCIGYYCDGIDASISVSVYDSRGNRAEADCAPITINQ